MNKTTILYSLFAGFLAASCTDGRSTAEINLEGFQISESDRLKDSTLRNVPGIIVNELQVAMIENLTRVIDQSEHDSVIKSTVPVKYQRGYVLHFGDFEIKKGAPLKTGNLTISVAGTDQILDALSFFEAKSRPFFVYLTSNKRENESEDDKIKRILTQQAYYLGQIDQLRMFISKTKSEKELMKALKQFRENILTITRENE